VAVGVILGKGGEAFGDGCGVAGQARRLRDGRLAGVAVARRRGQQGGGVDGRRGRRVRPEIGILCRSRKVSLLLMLELAGRGQRPVVIRQKLVDPEG